MKLLSAYYGVEQLGWDVTDKIRNLEVGNVIVIPVSLNLTQLLGDPAPNRGKKLVLKFKWGKLASEVKVIELWETHHHLNLCQDFCSADYVDPRSRVVFITHSFGAGTEQYCTDLQRVFPYHDYQTLYVTSNPLVIPPCEVIHLQSLLYLGQGQGSQMNWDLIATLESRAVAGCRVLLTIHDYQWLYPNSPTPTAEYLRDHVPDPKHLVWGQRLRSLCEFIIFPTSSVREYYQQYWDLVADRHLVVPHNDLDASQFVPPYLPKLETPKATINVGILGNLTMAKGRDLILAMAKMCPRVNFVVLGVMIPACDSCPALPNLKIVGKYDNADIFDLVGQHGIHILWLSSLVPETWSYTLTLSLATGLPIFYNDLGAYRDRLRKSRYPYYYDSVADSVAVIVGKLQTLITDLRQGQSEAKVYGVPKVKLVSGQWYRQVFSGWKIDQQLRIYRHEVLGRTGSVTDLVLRHLHLFTIFARDYHGVRFKRKSHVNLRGLIVETRMANLSQLIDVIWNFIYYLGDRANLTLITNSHMKEAFCAVMRDWSEIDFQVIPETTLNAETYSLLLTQPSLWEGMSESVIFIFQPDVLILRALPSQDFLGMNLVGPIHAGEWSYQGVKMNLNTPKGVGINGGVNFRQKSAMLRCLREVSLKRVNDYRVQHHLCPLPFMIDDVYYYTAMEILGLALPSDGVCHQFGLQDVPKLGLDYPYWVWHGFTHPSYLSDRQKLSVLSHACYDIGGRWSQEWRQLWSLWASFDYLYYAKAHPQLGLRSKMEVIRHYETQGWQLGLLFTDQMAIVTLPTYFDWRWYVDERVHPDLWKAGINTRALAIDHYLKYGHLEGRPYASLRGDDQASYFTQIYEGNVWACGQTESKSGEGATLLQTQTLRPQLSQLFSRLSITSILDAPCGDFNWMRLVALPKNCQYTGVDIVPSVIKTNQQTYGQLGRKFMVLDLCRGDMIPRVDLIFCRDCLGHLSLSEGLRALRRFVSSESIYVLITTYPQRLVNRDDVYVGSDRLGLRGWQPLNLQIAPFNFPPPMLLINEGCTESHGAFADKCLGLWKLSTLGSI